MTICVERDLRLSPEPIVRRESPNNAIKHPIQTRRWLLLVCVLAVVVLIAVAMDEVLRPQKFPLQNIRLSGSLQHVNRADIGVAIAPHIQGNYFSLNLNRIEEAIKALRWVDSVEVRRRWPRNLDIDIREQRPVAQWGKQSWMNSTGEVFAVDYRAAAETMPRFNGPPGSNTKILEHYRRWANVLAGTGLQIKDISLSARYEWSITVYLNRSGGSFPAPSVVGGQSQGLQKRRGNIGFRDRQFDPERLVTVVLGRHQVDVRLARFARVFRETLVAKAAYIGRVDLRYPNGFAVLWKELDFDPGSQDNGISVDSGKNQKTHYSNLFGLELEEAIGR